MNKIREAFETVKADEKLKNSALEAVRNRINEETERTSFKKRDRGFLGSLSFGKKLAYGAAICCSLILAVGIFGFYSAYTSPASYVSIDINPSMELALNRYNIVINAKGYNDDGNEALEDIELCGMKYTEAIEKLLESDQLQEYFVSDYELVFTVISQNQQELVEGIESTEGYKKYGSCCLTADYETREEAEKAGMTVGKYRAYQQLLMYYPDMTAEECSGLSMNQIKNLILEMGGEWEGGFQSGEQSGSHKGNQSGSQGEAQSGANSGNQNGSQSGCGGQQSGTGEGKQWGKL